MSRVCLCACTFSGALTCDKPLRQRKLTMHAQRPPTSVGFDLILRGLIINTILSIRRRACRCSRASCLHALTSSLILVPCGLPVPAVCRGVCLDAQHFASALHHLSRRVAERACQHTWRGRSIFARLPVERVASNLPTTRPDPGLRQHRCTPRARFRPGWLQQASPRAVGFGRFGQELAEHFPSPGWPR